MKPNETFSYLKNNQVHHDLVSLARYYQPIMGSQGLALYACLLAFDDQGAAPHQFADILNHLNIGMPEFEATLKKLIALQLLVFYRHEEGYLLQLRSPMDGSAFFSHQVLTALLEQKIGEAAVKQIKVSLPFTARPVPQKLSDIFEGTEDLPVARSVIADSDFDLANFKKLMAQDNLRFEDEKEDILALFRYAELGKKTWYETYQAAKASAIGNVISSKRLLATLTPQETVQAQFTETEKKFLRLAKEETALAFLKGIKAEYGASLMDDERRALAEMARLGLRDSVINVLVQYTLSKTQKVMLNEKYALKLANDFAFKKINSAEAAVVALRERRESSQRGRHKTGTPDRKSNVPEWSKEDYRTEATPEELEKLEALRRRALGDKEA